MLGQRERYLGDHGRGGLAGIGARREVARHAAGIVPPLATLIDSFDSAISRGEPDSVAGAGPSTTLARNFYRIIQRIRFVRITKATDWPFWAEGRC